jgi:hypothetical protein
VEIRRRFALVQRPSYRPGYERQEAVPLWSEALSPWLPTVGGMTSFDTFEGEPRRWVRSLKARLTRWLDDATDDSLRREGLLPPIQPPAEDDCKLHIVKPQAPPE